MMKSLQRMKIKADKLQEQLARESQKLTLIYRDGTTETVRDTLAYRVKLVDLYNVYHDAKYNGKPMPETEIIGAVFADGETWDFRRMYHEPPMTDDEARAIVDELREIFGGEV